MRLKSLALQNIRSYKEQTFNFPDGTTLFEGDIGAGKSTILMAIEFALFGLGSQKGAGLLKVGENEGTVKLDFSVNGSDYGVTRTLVRKRSSVNQGEGYIRTAEGIIHLSPAELKEKILEILNFKEPASPNAQSVIFRYAIFTPQEEMKYILTQKPNERIQTLRKAFGIEDYKIASDNCLELARYVKEGIIKLQERVGDIDRRKEELMQGEQTAEKLRKELERLSRDRTELEELQKSEKKKLEELRQKENKYNEAVAKTPLIEGQIGEKKKGIAELERRKSRLESEVREKLQPMIESLQKVTRPTEKNESVLKKMISDLKKLESNRDVLVGEESAAQKSIVALEKKLKQHKDKSSKNIENEIAGVDKLQKEAKADIQRVKLQLKKVTQEKNKLELQESELKEKIDDLKGVGGVCPICERVLSRDHKTHLKEERARKLKEIRKALPAIAREEKELNDKLIGLEGKREEYAEAVSNLKGVAQLITDLEEKKKESADIEKRLKSVQAGLVIEDERLFPTLSQYDNPSEYVQALLSRLTEYQNAQDKIVELNDNMKNNNEESRIISANIQKEQEEIGSIRNRLGQVKEVEETYKTIPSQIRSLNKTVEEREAKISGLHGEIGSHQARIEELKKTKETLENEIQRKEKERTLLSKYQDYHIWLTDFFIPTLSAIEKQVMISIRQDFEANFHKWYSMLLEEPDKDARIDEDFTPIIEQDGYEQDIGFLSGGERTSVALAYRLALNMTVQKVSAGMKSNLLILDEPTDGFSKVQLFKVREILRELNCPQVILVSHERELETFADQIFEVQKSNGLSHVVSR